MLLEESQSDSQHKSIYFTHNSKNNTLYDRSLTLKQKRLLQAHAFTCFQFFYHSCLSYKHSRRHTCLFENFTTVMQAFMFEDCRNNHNFLTITTNNTSWTKVINEINHWWRHTISYLRLSEEFPPWSRARQFNQKQMLSNSSLTFTLVTWKASFKFRKIYLLAASPRFW